MENTKKVNAKKTVVKTTIAENSKMQNTKKSATKEKIINLNLSQFADKLNSIEVKEKKDKLTIYRYPENFTKSEISSEKGKAFRNKLRNRRNTLINNILFSAKQLSLKKIEQKEFLQSVEIFKDFYTENYLINDFSLKSVSQSNNDVKNNDIQIAFDIIKQTL